jgi:8-oxo-dGTP pyrophosphatase MutT (NUDIX family)
MIHRYVAAGGVVVDDDRVLVLHRPTSGEVRLPKGHVEPGEAIRAAALRETHEESGYASLVLKADLGTQMVEFDHGGRHVVRTECYFLMGLADDADSTDRCGRRHPSDLHSGGEDQFETVWLTWDGALAALTFEAEREWVRRARRMCERTSV